MTLSVERGVYAGELVSLKTKAARRKVDLSARSLPRLSPHVCRVDGGRRRAPEVPPGPEASITL
jgi:hypothetical protein